MKNPLGSLMKQAQQMQEQMQSAQEELSHLEVEGEAGGGMVRLTMTCRHEVRNIQVDDALMGEDKTKSAPSEIELEQMSEPSGRSIDCGMSPGASLLSIPIVQ